MPCRHSVGMGVVDSYVYVGDDGGVRTLHVVKCGSCFLMTYSMRSKTLAVYQQTANPLIPTTMRVVRQAFNVVGG